MRTSFRWVFLLTMTVGICASSARADGLRFSRYFTDNMVLQRDKPNVVRGVADKGATVTVSFAGQSVTATAGDDGAWAATLKAMPANAQGATLSAKVGGDSASINGVLVGDVFMFARQTSINVSVAEQGGAAKVQATPLLRVIQIKTIGADQPRADLAADATGGWSALNARTTQTMSAAAWHFGRALASQTDVPIGVIDLNMGSYFPIGWLGRESLLMTEELTGNSEVERMVTRMENLLAAQKTGQQPKKEVITSPALEHPFYPAAGYNAVIHPLRGTALRGLVLQIGGNYPYTSYSKLNETNTHTDRAKLNAAYVETYDIRKVGFRSDPYTTPRVPREFRKAFGDDALPVGLVMAPGSALTTLAKHAVEMRELQRQTAEKLDGVSIILPGMEATPFSVQPRDEKLLGERSARWALGAVYGKPMSTATGPVFERIDTQFNTATVYFKPGTAEGLRATTDKLTGFEVAGVEGDYVPAEAVIDGDTVRLSSDTIRRVRRVRFNWALMPGEQLVNAAGLPALPFRSETAPYNWFHTHAEDSLPVEYSTPANEWDGGNVTLVNGQIKTHGYPNFTGWLGPLGIYAGPFGPNMGVRAVVAGSPAAGKVMVGDVIYSVNGKMLGDNAEHVMSAAITQSETREGGGKLTLGLRRGEELHDVELQLEVMGTYSPTSPFDCAKTEKIVDKLEGWLAARGGADENFLNSDVLFLLAAGSPEHQRHVRRHVYNKLNFSSSGNNWYLGYDTILLAEYYLATGDRKVLPALERMAQNIVDHQIGVDETDSRVGRIGGWYGKNKAFRNYPTMPSAGLACMIGLTLAREAGVPVDEAAYQRGLEHFRGKGAAVGAIIYGDAWRDQPYPLNPKVMEAGRISSDNGKLSLGAVLFELAGERRTSHYLSLISTYAFNHTFYGHGGNFWNNFWTPIGANVHSRDAFLHFMEGHRWYRELNRMYDGSLIQNEQSVLGGGTGLALVIPDARLRILGAASSPFASIAPDNIKPAVAAYRARDYAKAEALVAELLDSGTVQKADLPTVQKLAEETRRIQQSIDADLTWLASLVEQGRFHEANLYISQLEGVIADGDKRLAAIKQGLTGQPRANDKALYEQAQAALVPATARKLPVADQQTDWTCVVTEMTTNPKDKALGKRPEEDANRWRLRVVEDRSQAPDGWMNPGFDASDWTETALPISWRLNHTALLRTTFQIDDPAKIDGMRFRGWLFRQQDIAIYINGKLVGRVNNLEKKTGNVDAVFEDGARKALKAGENTLAIATQQNWRWGMLFMRVYNDGFGFMLDVSHKP